MKITGQQPPEFHGIKGGTNKDSQKNAGVLENTSGAGDPPVKTSTFVMNKIKSQISKEPEVRTELVAELKAKIKSGEYEVDPQSLAKTLLEDSIKEDIA